MPTVGGGYDLNEVARMRDVGYTGAPSGYGAWAASRTPMAALNPATAATATPGTVTTTTGTGGSGVNTPGFQEALDLINSLNIKAQQESNAARIPNATALEQQSSTNIGSALGGVLPPDVLRLLGQQGAERGIATGNVGAPNTDAAYMRALGLTSLDLQNTGQNWLNQAYGRNPGAPLYDPTNLMITPAQQAELDFRREQLAAQQQMEAARLAAQMAAAARARAASGGGGGIPWNGGGGGFIQPRPADLTPYIDTSPAPSGQPGTWSSSARTSMFPEDIGVSYDLPEWMRTAANPIWNGNFNDATVSYDLPAALPDFSTPFDDWLSGVGLSY